MKKIALNFSTKFLSLVLSIMMLISIMPFSTSAATYSGKCGDNIIWNLDTSSRTLILSGTGSTYGYGENKSPWYSYNSYILSITVEEGITTLGNRIFNNLTYVKSISLPKSLKYCDDYVFAGCVSLVSIDFPTMLQTLGHSALSGCKTLKEVTFPDSLITIGPDVCWNCTGLKKVTIGKSISAISGTSFYNNTSLREIIIPKNVTNIDSAVFSGCSNLSVYCDKGSYAEQFAKNKGFYTASIHNEGEWITIQQPTCVLEGVEAVYCTDCGIKLDERPIPMLPHEYGEWIIDSEPTLLDCGSKHRICSKCDYEEVNSLSALDWIYDNNELTVAYKGTMPDFSTTECPWSEYKDEVKSVEILDCTTTIGRMAFSDCVLLNNVSIPNSVTRIENDAFFSCFSLETVHIPEGVTSIGDSSFEETGLTSLILPFGLESIGNYAFYDCFDLSEIAIPETVTFIGVDAFYGCDNLVIKCSEGSYADSFAKENSISVEYHDFNEWTIETEPKCAVAGTEKRECAICGVIERKPIEALGHTFGEWTLTEPLFCMNDSSYIRKCSVCGATETKTEVARGKHSFDVVEESELNDALEFNGHYYKVYANCNTWNSAKEYCEKLGGHLATITSGAENSALYSYVASKGYSTAFFGYTDEAVEGKWVWVTGETSSYTNWNTDEPNNRDDEDYAQFINSAGKWNDIDFSAGCGFICEWDEDVVGWNTITEPTCSTLGQESRTCSICNYTEYRDIPTTKHTFGEWMLTEPLFCMKDSSYIRKCSVCGATETKTEAARGKHSFGLADDSDFSDALEFNGHYYKVYANCNTWNSAKEYCEKLGGHLATITSGAENSALYSYVSSKGYSTAFFGYTDEAVEGKWVWITGETSSYTNWCYSEPNNTNDEDYAQFYSSAAQWNDNDFIGSYGFICEWDEDIKGWKAITEPTCTEIGEETRTCSICNYTENRDIPALGHKEAEERVEATCTDDGFSRIYCATCKEEFSYTTLEKLGGEHVWGEWSITLAPTHSAEGSRNHTCTICNYVETEAIPVIGKTEVIVENYSITVTNGDEINTLRIAPGTLNTSNDIRKADGLITLDTKTISSHIDSEGNISYNLPDGGEYTLWYRYNDGTTGIIHIDATFMTQTVDVYGVSITVNNLYGVKDFFISKGHYTTYRDVATNRFLRVTPTDFGDKHSYKYGAALPGEGEYTLWIRYSDTSREPCAIYFNCEVIHPTLETDGRQITIGNLDGVKVVRIAPGTYSTMSEIKGASGAVGYSASSIAKLLDKDGKLNVLKNATEEGTAYTLAIVYDNLYQEIHNITLTKKVPTYTVNGDSITFTNLDGLSVLRYAPGEYSTGSGIKSAKGSKYIKSAENGTATFTGLSGKYSFMVQYYEGSQSFFVIDF